MKPRKMTIFNLVWAIYENTLYFRPEARKKLIAKIRADRARRFIRREIRSLRIKDTTDLVQSVATGLKERYKKGSMNLQKN